MLDPLFDIERYLSGSVLIVLFVLCSLGGLMAARRYLDLNRMQRHHDVAGNMFAVGGTLYAVLLGLVVVDAMSTFQSAQANVEKEADALANVFMLAERLPSPLAERIQQLCTDYVRDVVMEEWPLMERGQTRLEARHLALGLVRELSGFEPITENHKAVYPLMLQQALDVRDQRRARISMVLHGVPAVEWLVLGLGGVITIFFTYFFWMESSRIQLLMTAMVALLVALNVYLVVLFGSPFSGDLVVEPEPLRMDLELFESPAPTAPKPHP
jgi:hypothetical protein